MCVRNGVRYENLILHLSLTRGGRETARERIPVIAERNLLLIARVNVTMLRRLLPLQHYVTIEKLLAQRVDIDASIRSPNRFSASCDLDL